MTLPPKAFDREALLAILRRQFQKTLPARIGIAVSGGGDSLALMYLLEECFRDQPVELMVATVDHGLRPEARSEAEQVATQAQALGLRHSILTWKEGPEEIGNLQDQARQARLDLLTTWARRNGIPILTLGHTADDQAETVLMRLSRAAGVNGLAGIPQRRTQGGVSLLRPLLEVRRETLRAYLRSLGVSWIDDPSNEDERFERIRARKAMTLLEELGLTTEVLSTVAQNMSKARKALGWYAFLEARDMMRFESGAIVVDLRKFRVLSDEMSHRLMTQAILWISGSQYPPRRQPMIETVAAAQRGCTRTLGGCHIRRHRDDIWICREAAAVQHKISDPGEIWDKRWRVFAGDTGACEVRMLGEEGLKHCPEWRDLGAPSAALEVTPALWRDGKLLAAPLAGLANGTTAEPINSAEEFFASLLSH